MKLGKGPWLKDLGTTLLFVLCTILCFLLIIDDKGHEMKKAKTPLFGLWGETRCISCITMPNLGEQNGWLWRRALRRKEMMLCLHAFGGYVMTLQPRGIVLCHHSSPSAQPVGRWAHSSPTWHFRSLSDCCYSLLPTSPYFSGPFSVLF